jgi:hypothetical protein
MNTENHLGEGFHEMTAAQYHADPCVQPSLSSSVAATLINRSPLHAAFEHPRLSHAGGKKATTDEMDFGSVVHELVLGKGGGFAVWEGDTWRGKEAAAFWDAAISEGKTPTKKADHARAEIVAETLRNQTAAMGLGHIFSEGVSEQVSIWQEDGVWCRAMFDRWLRERGEIWDIKTMSESAHPKACAARVASMNYDMRSEFYLMGARKNAPELQGKIKFGFLFVETKAPFAVTPAILNGEWNAIGVSKACRAISLWKQCLASGNWPSYCTEIQRLEAPAWALPQEISA